MPFHWRNLIRLSSRRHLMKSGCFQEPRVNAITQRSHLCLPKAPNPFCTDQAQSLLVPGLLSHRCPAGLGQLRRRHRLGLLHARRVPARSSPSPRTLPEMPGSGCSRAGAAPRWSCTAGNGPPAASHPPTHPVRDPRLRAPCSAWLRWAPASALGCWGSSADPTALEGWLALQVFKLCFIKSHVLSLF